MHRTLLALIVVVALLAAVPVSAPAHFGGAPADSAQKKKRKKAKKCKRSQIKVKVGKRRTVCRPFKKAFPAPKAGDPVELFTKAALGDDFSGMRDRRGRRLPSLPKLIRQAGRGAPALLSRMTARGFARIDGLQAAAGVASARSWAAQTENCRNLSQAPRQRDTYTSEGGDGTRARARAEMGPDGASMGIELEGNGMTISVDIDMGLCAPDRVEAPECPTAAGQLDGEIRYKFKVAVQVSRPGVDVWSQAREVERRTKLQGFNEVDAKLDQLHIEDLETSTLRLGGEARGYSPITVQSRIERRTQVDMRSGSFDPGRSRVDASISMAGLSGPDREEAEEEFERKTQADADRQFAAIIEKAIAGYRSREEGWNALPPRCAELRLSPEKNSLTLRGGDSGTFTATAIAKSDGGQSELDAKLTEMQLASFSPTRAGGQRAQFAYENVVGSVPAGSKVHVKVTATSKAGVAEGIWEQRIEPPFEINQISGNFAGSQSVVIGGRTARVTWNGSARFERTPASGFPGAFGNYFIKAGQATFHYSGQTITAHAVCNMRGSAFVDLFQDAGGSIGVMSVDPVNVFAKGPHDYGGLVSLAGDAPMVTLTMENCIPEADDEEGKQYEIPVGIPPFDTGPGETQRSPDGIHYDGSWSGSHSGASWEYSWTMIGEKVSPAP